MFRKGKGETGIEQLRWYNTLCCTNSRTIIVSSSVRLCSLLWRLFLVTKFNAAPVARRDSPKGEYDEVEGILGYRSYEMTGG